MTGVPPEDDDALRWEGDELDRPIARPVRPAPVVDADGTVELTGTSSLGLLLIGILAGVALLETIGWIRGITGAALAATIGTGSGTTGEVVLYLANLLSRVAAVAAAPAWFGLVLWRGPAGARRILWLVLGAVLLIPWPALVHT